MISMREAANKALKEGKKEQSFLVAEREGIVVEAGAGTGVV